MSFNTSSSYQPFDAIRLINTVFAPKPEERICLLLDFTEPQALVTDKRFLSEPGHDSQNLAYKQLFEPLMRRRAETANQEAPSIFAYKSTAGSNLDLPDVAYDEAGREVSFVEDIYKVFQIVLCVSTYSATAPLTAFAKQYGFRGATLHGLNEVILSSGLAVDYEQVSADAERMRLKMTSADAVEIDFTISGEKRTLRLELGQQGAQKSHGLCRENGDIVNLPAGEIYFVPHDASGWFPMSFDDQTSAWLKVDNGRVTDAELLRGSKDLLKTYLDRVKEDPMVGAIGELGFGTQNLPVSGSDIQDEKILGTFHIATGRNDHLGGDITPDKFRYAHNATHEDILFSKETMPELAASEVRLFRDGQVTTLYENLTPTKALLS